MEELNAVFSDSVMRQSDITVCRVATKTVDILRKHMKINFQNFFHTCVKFIIFPLVHEETQIQNWKCREKCGMKMPVIAACVWTRSTWSTSDHVERKTWTFEDCSFSKSGFVWVTICPVFTPLAETL
jgi:hypothetical protein